MTDRLTDAEVDNYFIDLARLPLTRDPKRRNLPAPYSMTPARRGLFAYPKPPAPSPAARVGLAPPVRRPPPPDDRPRLITVHVDVCSRWTRANMRDSSPVAFTVDRCYWSSLLYHYHYHRRAGTSELALRATIYFALAAASGSAPAPMSAPRPPAAPRFAPRMAEPSVADTAADERRAAITLIVAIVCAVVTAALVAVF
jgi:hypothetical protein